MKNDLGWFFATRIRIRFIVADLDPADQNETDPNLSGSATLGIMVNVFSGGPVQKSPEKIVVTKPDSEETAEVNEQAAFFVFFSLF